MTAPTRQQSAIPALDPPGLTVARSPADRRAAQVAGMQARLRRARRYGDNGPSPRWLHLGAIVAGVLARGDPRRTIYVTSPVAASIFVVPARLGRYAVTRAAAFLAACAVIFLAAFSGALIAATVPAPAVLIVVALTLAVLVVPATWMGDSLRALHITTMVARFPFPLTHYSYGLGRSPDHQPGGGAAYLASLHAWIDTIPGGCVGGHVDDNTDDWARLRDWYLAHGRTLVDPDDPHERRTYHPHPPPPS